MLVKPPPCHGDLEQSYKSDVCRSGMRVVSSHHSPCDLAVLPINLNGNRVAVYTGEVLEGSLEFQRLTLSNLTRGAPTYW